MNEWTDPKYAEALAALRKARQRQAAQGGAARPVRGFLIPTGK